MQIELPTLRFALRVILVAGCLASSSLASDSVISGTVTDSSGKPVRGATVKATAGIKSVSRFSQNDGRYQLTVAPGTYDLSVDAFGFGVARTSVDTANAASTDFHLQAAAPDLLRLTGSELESLLPDTREAKLLQGRCDSCHSFPTILHMRGLTAAKWKSFLPSMVRGSTSEPMANASPAALDEISAALEKYFGPDSPYIGPHAGPIDPGRIHHVDLSDEALRATVVEFDVPTKNAKPHSIEIENRTNVAWFGEESYFGNKLIKFDINSETFREFPLLTEKARPHTGGIAEDGTYWIALAHSNDPAKLGSVDPKTGEVKQYNWPEQEKTAAHTLALDHKGNIWLSGSPSGEIWSFSIKDKEFKTHQYPVPKTIPKGVLQEWEEISGEQHSPQASTYDVAVDNEGMIWFSQIQIGTLMRLDPATGKTKVIRPEGVVSIRGITVDADDNLWFGDFHGHRFGKLNVKTEAVKFYKPPTPNVTVYGVAFNKVDRNIWYADMNGNNITRFNPRTEQFTEFRIPSRPDRTYARFIGADAKGRVWFTEYFGDKIGYVDPTGGSSVRIASVQ